MADIIVYGLAYLVSTTHEKYQCLRSPVLPLVADSDLHLDAPAPSTTEYQLRRLHDQWAQRGTALYLRAAVLIDAKSVSEPPFPGIYSTNETDTRILPSRLSSNPSLRRSSHLRRLRRTLICPDRRATPYVSALPFSKSTIKPDFAFPAHSALFLPLLSATTHFRSSLSTVLRIAGMLGRRRQLGDTPRNSRSRD